LQAKQSTSHGSELLGIVVGFLEDNYKPIAMGNRYAFKRWQLVAMSSASASTNISGQVDNAYK